MDRWYEIIKSVNQEQSHSQLGHHQILHGVTPSPTKRKPPEGDNKRKVKVIDKEWIYRPFWGQINLFKH